MNALLVHLIRQFHIVQKNALAPERQILRRKHNNFYFSNFFISFRIGSIY